MLRALKHILKTESLKINGNKAKNVSHYVNFSIYRKSKLSLTTVPAPEFSVPPSNSH